MLAGPLPMLRRILPKTSLEFSGIGQKWIFLATRSDLTSYTSEEVVSKLKVLRLVRAKITMTRYDE